MDTLEDCLVQCFYNWKLFTQIFILNTWTDIFLVKSGGILGTLQMDTCWPGCSRNIYFTNTVFCSLRTVHRNRCRPILPLKVWIITDQYVLLWCQSYRHRICGWLLLAMCTDACRVDNSLGSPRCVCELHPAYINQEANILLSFLQ